jgi:uncharacterized membrane protein HdeD (DUF308 family)
VISVFVAWYLLIRGIFDVVIALSHTHVRGWWMPLVAGIIGIWSIFKGVADLMASFEYKRLGQELAA